MTTKPVTAKNLHDAHSLLFNILKWKRPAFSMTDEMVISKFIDPIPGVVADGFGNRWVTIPNPDGTDSKTLFSCHTDTVHHDEGEQDIYLDTHLHEVFVKDSNCLGADDGTGMYIMIMMINNRVPGTYIFHRAEEIGGQGSSFIRKEWSEDLKRFDRAIAFDRKGQDDVIIAQSPGRIASEKFGQNLAIQLNLGTGFKFSNSTTNDIKVVYNITINHVN